MTGVQAGGHGESSSGLSTMMTGWVVLALSMSSSLLKDSFNKFDLVGQGIVHVYFNTEYDRLML